MKPGDSTRCFSAMLLTGAIFVAYLSCFVTSSAEDIRMSVMLLSEQVRDLQHRQERSNMETGRDLAEILEDLARIKDVNDDRNGHLNELVTEFTEQKEVLRKKLKEASSSVSRILRGLQTRSIKRRHVSQGSGVHRDGPVIHALESHLGSIADKVADLALDVQGLVHDLSAKPVVNDNCFRKNLRKGKYPMSRLVTAWCPTALGDTGKGTCADLMRSGYREDGVYAIRMGDKTVPAFCDMSTDGGGWNVLLRSHSPTITSSGTDTHDNQLWNQIGDLSLDFWWGWENVLRLTHSKAMELKVIRTSAPHSNHSNELSMPRQALTIGRDGDSYTLTIVYQDEHLVNKTKRVMKLTGESVKVSQGDGEIILECTAAVVRRSDFEQDVASLDLKCLSALFAGREAGYTVIVIMVRPKLASN